MPSTVKNLRWGVEQRLEFIESRVFWDGGINRSEITEHFGVSVPQASNDLARYNELAPKNLDYDRSEKRYFASKAFRPILLEPDAEAYLANAAQSDDADELSALFQVDTIPLPHRRVDAAVLRSLLAALRENASIEIKYQSMNKTRPEPVWRRISPHAFGNDGLRWHVRAFCHIDHRFKDFLLSRCLSARDQHENNIDIPADTTWNQYFDVLLTPNPKLSDNQRNVIAWDYGMPDHQLKIPVRKALLYYFEKRLRLDISDRIDKPQETPVIILNRKEFDEALAEAG